MQTCLLLFAKVPRAGDVKTRLTPVLTPEEAARLYRAFLQDTLRQVTNHLSVDVRLYLAPPLPEEKLDGVPAAVSIHEQVGSGLGARMQQAFEEVFHAGYDRGLVMGSDHPTLPPSFLRRGVKALQTPRSISIGPTEDGGFYLLGMSAFYPELFENMTYSHPGVFSDTLARIERTDARLTVLPRWYDVDTPPDLRRMLADLDDRTIRAPNTRRVAEDLRLGERK